MYVDVRLWKDFASRPTSHEFEKINKESEKETAGWLTNGLETKNSLLGAVNGKPTVVVSPSLHPFPYYIYMYACGD